jgi:hypothetical protein
MSIAAIREPRLAPPGATAPKPPAQEGSSLPASEAAGPRATSPFALLVRGLGREVQRGEVVMRGALQASGAGGALAPAELIALQAGVYRYSEAVDLAAKLIDHATSGLKTIVQGQ